MKLVLVTFLTVSFACCFSDKQLSAIDSFMVYVTNQKEKRVGRVVGQSEKWCLRQTGQVTFIWG